MNIHCVLFFCFFSALCGGNTGLVSAKLDIYAGAEGGTGAISCYFTLSGSRKFFCKNECKAEDILVKTDDVRAQSGRYSIEYRDGSSGRRIVSVTITNLTKSDSGRYRCGLGGTSVPESFRDFEVSVSDDWTSTIAVLMYVVSIPVMIVSVPGLTLMIIFIQKYIKPKGLQTRGNSDGTNTEIALYENCPPASTSESTYESLDPASRDQNQTYSTLTHTEL
ncbi:uncharacterized protein LOC119905021 [Micropterus salmoides]|uniref:uncharacterized protein LOC119905021 n=1 Tax=Micropterus salmoides TaxID=27706 RepID=UPI0018ED4EAE|nr:uncharacterized protein LOC119905021 [Micropterus salmoides]